MSINISTLRVFKAVVILDAAALSILSGDGTTHAARPSPAMPVERPARPDFVCVPHARFHAAQLEGALSCSVVVAGSVDAAHRRLNARRSS